MKVTPKHDVCLTKPIPWASYQIRKNYRLRMHRGCRERFSCHRLQRKSLVSDPGMHHGTCVTDVMHVGIANPRRRANVPGIPVACATRNLAYLARGPCPLMTCSDDYIILQGCIIFHHHHHHHQVVNDTIPHKHKLDSYRGKLMASTALMTCPLPNV